MLTKSKYMAGLQCPKLLWLKQHESNAPELVPNAQAEHLFRLGHEVGEEAKKFAGPGFENTAKAYGKQKEFGLKSTHEALSTEQRIFEGFFEDDGVFVAIDILERIDNSRWRAIEVKSSSAVKPQHFCDIALQGFVANKCGVNVAEYQIITLNREYRHQISGELFVRHDVTQKALGLQSEIPKKLEQLQAVVRAQVTPDVFAGKQCKSPYPCPFFKRCNKSEKHDVSSLYRASLRLRKTLADGDVTSILQLQEDADIYSAIQNRQIKSVKTATPFIDKNTLRKELKKLKGTIGYLDFETIMPAIPVWAGDKPWQTVPVQYSLYVPGSKTQHRDFIFSGIETSDPRIEFAKNLIEHCKGGIDTLVGYNTSYEIRCIRSIISAFPEFETELEDICSRFVDLLPIIRNNLYNEDLYGSFSLKAVFPALVTESQFGSYKDLSIANGADAAVALYDCIVRRKYTSKTYDQLIAYCRLDVTSLSEIHQRLIQITE